MPYTTEFASADTQERYAEAVKTLRRNLKESGIVARVRQNVASCCRGCITSQQMGMGDTWQAYAATFGGQGRRLQWVRGNPVTNVKRDRYGWSGETAEAETSAYWMFGGAPDCSAAEDVEVGRHVATAFRSHGFEVEWDGTRTQTVIVKFPEPVLL